MACRSWFVMTPNEAKMTENMLACLQADLTPAGMCAHGSNARMRQRVGEIKRVCTCISRSGKTPSQREIYVAVRCA